MTVKNIEPLKIRPDAFCLPPETGCEILNVLNEINKDFIAEFNNNNCKAKDTLAGFAQAFTVIMTQALSHIGEFFDFEKDEKIIDRVINHPSKDPLILNLKKLKIDPFLCETIAYYQEKIAPIRNRVLFFNECEKSSKIWMSFSENNLIEILNTLKINFTFFDGLFQLDHCFRHAADYEDIQIIRALLVVANPLKKSQFFEPGFHSGLTFIGALDNATQCGHTKILSALIEICGFDVFYLTRALHDASYDGHLKIVQMLINSGHFLEISADAIDTALKEASSNEHSHIVQEIKATDHFKQLLKDFPEKFNKYL
jgi:hypothetical protein